MVGGNPYPHGLCVRFHYQLPKGVPVDVSHASRWRCLFDGHYFIAGTYERNAWPPIHGDLVLCPLLRGAQGHVAAACDRPATTSLRFEILALSHYVVKWSHCFEDFHGALIDLFCMLDHHNRVCLGRERPTCPYTRDFPFLESEIADFAHGDLADDREQSGGTLGSAEGVHRAHGKIRPLWNGQTQEHPPGLHRFGHDPEKRAVNGQVLFVQPSESLEQFSCLIRERTRRNGLRYCIFLAGKGWIDSGKYTNRSCLCQK